MARGEIVINEANCLGCGYCQEFCNHKCIVMSADKFSPRGNVLPVFVDPERCNACGICGWMCPHMGIEVYKYVESSS
jgi:formate hydrogenlyase subunit 6/NADH:ubiquinone oxidoreductase subunit I